jgi:hypothetical protein
MLASDLTHVHHVPFFLAVVLHSPHPTVAHKKIELEPTTTAISTPFFRRKVSLPTDIPQRIFCVARLLGFLFPFAAFLLPPIIRLSLSLSGSFFPPAEHQLRAAPRAKNAGGLSCPAVPCARMSWRTPSGSVVERPESRSPTNCRGIRLIPTFPCARFRIGAIAAYFDDDIFGVSVNLMHFLSVRLSA